MGESHGLDMLWSIEFVMKLKKVLRSEYLSFLVEDLWPSVTVTRKFIMSSEEIMDIS